MKAKGARGKQSKPKSKPHRAMGRKSDYDANKHPKLAKKYAEEGKTDEEIALSLGIGKTALYDWKNAHPEFAVAIKEGKAKPNREVRAAFYRRAVGYKTRRVIYAPGAVGPDGKLGKGRVLRIEEFEVPPSTTAGIFWLKNREPEEWKDVSRIDATVRGGLTVEEMHKRLEAQKARNGDSKRRG
ncbi:MAG: transposase [bacterium]